MICPLFRACDVQSFVMCLCSLVCLSAFLLASVCLLVCLRACLSGYLFVLLLACLFDTDALGSSFISLFLRSHDCLFACLLVSCLFVCLVAGVCWAFLGCLCVCVNLWDCAFVYVTCVRSLKSVCSLLLLLWDRECF